MSKFELSAQGDEVAFLRERGETIARQGSRPELRSASVQWLEQAGPRYGYNFDWFGRPIIQLPQDIVAMQEIVFATKPDLIIETGIARGGSLIFSASMLALIDYCDAISSNDPAIAFDNRRKVLGIDNDIRPHNRAAVEAHPLFGRIEMIEGDSTCARVIDLVRSHVARAESVMVCLDSNHTHDHVFNELMAYASFVTKGNYCVVFDTIIEDLSPELIGERPWGKGNSPKSAVHEFLKTTSAFEIDRSIDAKLLLTVATDGYLRRIA